MNKIATLAVVLAFTFGAFACGKTAAKTGDDAGKTAAKTGDDAGKTVKTGE